MQRIWHKIFCDTAPRNLTEFVVYTNWKFPRIRCYLGSCYVTTVCWTSGTSFLIPSTSSPRNYERMVLRHTLPKCLQPHVHSWRSLALVCTNLVTTRRQERSWSLILYSVWGSRHVFEIYVQNVFVEGKDYDFLTKLSLNDLRFNVILDFSKFSFNFWHIIVIVIKFKNRGGIPTL